MLQSSQMDLNHEDASSYQPSSVPSSSFGKKTTHEKTQLQRGVRADQHVLVCEEDPNFAKGILQRYLENAITDGWCVRVDRKGNKPGDWGYIQVSAHGSNHFALLQEVVLWADGRYCSGGDTCSHLCHHSNCANTNHIITEPAVNNERRKYCRVRDISPLTLKATCLSLHREDYSAFGRHAKGMYAGENWLFQLVYPAAKHMGEE